MVRDSGSQLGICQSFVRSGAGVWWPFVGFSEARNFGCPRYDSHTLHSFKLRRRDEVDEPSRLTKVSLLWLSKVGRTGKSNEIIRQLLYYISYTHIHVYTVCKRFNMQKVHGVGTIGSSTSMLSRWWADSDSNEGWEHVGACSNIL